MGAGYSRYVMRCASAAHSVFSKDSEIATSCAQRFARMTQIANTLGTRMKLSPFEPQFQPYRAEILRSGMFWSGVFWEA